ncbi:MAG: hypothetical protein K6F79_07680 [Saccharofermentans sp.]|nr:hypothetical protein [Saccharofermentans sp.]
MKNKMAVLMIASFVVASVGFITGVSSGSGFDVDAAEVIKPDDSEVLESALIQETVIEETYETTEEIIITETVESADYQVDETVAETAETSVTDFTEDTENTEETEQSEESVETTEETEPLVFDVTSEVLNGIYVPNFNYGADGHSVSYFDDEGVLIADFTDEGVTMNEEAWRMRGIDAYYGFDVPDDVFEQIIGAYDLICAGE